MVTNWLQFWQALLPGLMGLAKALFQRHGGDARAANAELTAIRNHGARLERAEDEIDRDLNAITDGD